MSQRCQCKAGLRRAYRHRRGKLKVAVRERVLARLRAHRPLEGHLHLVQLFVALPAGVFFTEILAIDYDLLMVAEPKTTPKWLVIPLLAEPFERKRICQSTRNAQNPGSNRA